MLKITISRENSQSACSHNSRDTWKTLNSLIQCKNTSKYVTLNHNGSSISDPSVVADVFNNYFSNIACNLDHNILHSNISPLNFLGGPVENSFFCPQPSDSEEIVNLIHWQKNKSTDLMNISVLYKILAPLISKNISPSKYCSNNTSLLLIRICQIQFQCSLITRCLKVFFKNALKQLKLLNF